MKKNMDKEYDYCEESKELGTAAHVKRGVDRTVAVRGHWRRAGDRGRCKKQAMQRGQDSQRSTQYVDIINGYNPESRWFRCGYSKGSEDRKSVV